MAGHLWLVGMMGAGKTTVGHRLGSRVEAVFIDTDDEVVAGSGRSIPELWEIEGEPGFRDEETAAIQRVAAVTDRLVAAAGGGAVLRPENVAAMRGSGLVVWLTATPTTLAIRTGSEGGRPLLEGGDPVDQLGRLAEERRHQYESAANRRVDTEGRSIDQVVDELEVLWRSM